MVAGQQQQYVLTSNGLLEVNRVRQAASSWLVDQAFISGKPVAFHVLRNDSRALQVRTGPTFTIDACSGTTGLQLLNSTAKCRTPSRSQAYKCFEWLCAGCSQPSQSLIAQSLTAL